MELVEKNVKSIFLAVASSELGGTEIQLAKMAREFQDNGITTKVIILSRRGPINEILSRFGIETHNLNLFAKNPLVSFISFVRYLELIKRNKPSVLYSFLPHAIISSSAAFFFLKKNTLMVSGIRGSSKKRNKSFEYCFNLCLKKSDLVICNTHLLETEVINRWNIAEEKCFVIPNGVDIPSGVADCSKTAVQAIVISNFLPYKGYENLIDILSTINTKCKYVFCGNGTVEQIQSLRAKIVTNKLSEQIELRISEQNLETLILNSQFAIHPSLQEGLSNAILEEIASGLPVVAFDVGGNSQLIRNGYNGYLSPRLDNNSFAKGIKNLLEDVLLRNTFGSNSRKLAENFNFKVLLERYLKLFELKYEEKFH